mmetsp:Transcript_10538/g.25444  ORF Transcript_10538/g.25444 Transcript_10538/m.25444 type:complete len:248 (+) Transcript_10538:42-785(+)
MPIKVLVVGATGATGKHVVQMLLDQNHHVTAIVRSKESMLRKLKKNDENYGDRLEIHQASILKMSHLDLMLLTKGCDFVVSCLGHNMTFKGMFLKDRKLVTQATTKLTRAMPSTCKFILMGSEGVKFPGVDPKRVFAERSILFLLRYLVPPHADNEGAAAYLLKANKSFHWTIMRPAALVDEEKANGEYKISDKADTPLFGDQTVSRNNVAHFMVKLMTQSGIYDQHLHKMPVIMDPTPANEKKSGN